MSGPTLPDLTDWRQAVPGEVIPVGVPYLRAAGNGVTVLYQGASATGATVSEGTDWLYYRGPAPVEEPPTEGVIVYQDKYGEWGVANWRGDVWADENSGEPVTFALWAPIGEWRQRP